MTNRQTELMSRAWEALVEAGVECVPVDADHVDLRHGRHTARLRVATSARPLTPGRVTEAVERRPDPCLVVLPSATPAVQQAIEGIGWSWLVPAPTGARGRLRLGRHVVP